MIRFSSALCAVCVFCLTGCQGNSVVQNKGPDAKVAGDKSEDKEMKFSLAKLREQDDQLVKAKKTYEELLQADPENADYNHRYGVVLFRLGRYEDGIEALRVADSTRPNDPEILNDLGFSCMVTGENTQAISVFETALEVDPQNERATNNLAMAHGYNGEFDEAYAIFQRIMTEAQAMSNLGYIATQSGRKEFAIECYSRALDLDPEMDEAKEALVQLADLERRIEQRRSIASESVSNAEKVIHASASVPAGQKNRVRQAN
jgi:Flp pilus assembly protein TadD